MAGKQTPNHQTNGKPAGMSDDAWIKLHNLAARICLNHADEIRALKANREKVKTG